LEPLLSHLGLPTLVITDIDALDATGKAAPVERNSGQRTNNATLKSWVPKIESVDELLDLSPDKRLLPFDDMSAVRVAYQLPTTVEVAGVQDVAHPYTFEDALVFSNLEIFKELDGTGLVAKFKSAIATSITVEELADSMFTSLKTGKKAEFALDVLALADPETFVIPAYIAEGLTWLQAQLVARQLEVVETESAVKEDAR
jgi:hypothetical protein